jgi:MoaA/NifB/PqqE/SkfB family radical SAM enzyme
MSKFATALQAIRAFAADRTAIRRALRGSPEPVGTGGTEPNVRLLSSHPTPSAAAQPQTTTPPDLFCKLPDPLRPGSVIEVIVRTGERCTERDLFLRLDLYPMLAPASGRRHFGYWDVRWLQSGDGRILLFWDGQNLVANGDGVTVNANTGPFFEDGYIVAHASIWRGGDAPRLLTIRSMTSIICQTDRTPPLRNVFGSATDVCNLGCIMCPREHLYYTISDIDPVILNRLGEAAPDLLFISLQGYGEPLLNKGIYDIVRDLKSRMPSHGVVGFHSNGTAHNRRNNQKLIQSGLDLLVFSVDGATKETYERIRVGANFERVIEQIEDFNRVLSEYPTAKMSVGISMVVFPDTIHEVPGFVRLAARCGFQAAHVNYEITSLDQFDFAAVEREWALARLVAEEVGIGVALPPTRPKPPEEETCPFMQTAIVLNSGDVIACCRFASPDTISNRDLIHSFGNVKTDSLQSIWRSDRYESFRKAVIGKEWPNICSGCDYKNGMLL